MDLSTLPAYPPPLVTPSQEPEPPSPEFWTPRRQRFLLKTCWLASVLLVLFSSRVMANGIEQLPFQTASFYGYPARANLNSDELIDGNPSNTLRFILKGERWETVYGRFGKPYLVFPCFDRVGLAPYTRDDTLRNLPKRCTCSIWGHPLYYGSWVYLIFIEGQVHSGPYIYSSPNAKPYSK